MEKDHVEALDEVWRRLGYKSRMDFFRQALGHCLRHHEEEVALFLTE